MRIVSSPSENPSEPTINCNHIGPQSILQRSVLVVAEIRFKLKVSRVTEDVVRDHGTNSYMAYLSKNPSHRMIGIEISLWCES